MKENKVKLVTPKHQMETALSDLKALALQYAQERSLDHLKNYQPGGEEQGKTDYVAGKIAGVAEFLLFAKRETDGLYAIPRSETD